MPVNILSAKAGHRHIEIWPVQQGHAKFQSVCGRSCLTSVEQTSWKTFGDWWLYQCIVTVLGTTVKIKFPTSLDGMSTSGHHYGSQWFTGRLEEFYYSSDRVILRCN